VRAVRSFWVSRWWLLLEFTTVFMCIDWPGAGRWSAEPGQEFILIFVASAHRMLARSDTATVVRFWDGVVVWGLPTTPSPLRCPPQVHRRRAGSTNHGKCGLGPIRQPGLKDPRGGGFRDGRNASSRLPPANGSLRRGSIPHTESALPRQCAPYRRNHPPPLWSRVVGRLEKPVHTSAVWAFPGQLT
jgi:hypothetical protein